jgi:hypothetical protein
MNIGERNLVSMRQILFLSTISLLFFQDVNYSQDILYQIDFSTPPHIVGSPMVMESGHPTRHTASSSLHGTQQVVSSYLGFTQQPLKFIALPVFNDRSYSQFRLALDDMMPYPHYTLSFDLSLGDFNPASAWDEFVVLFDTPSIVRLDFRKDGTIRENGSTSNGHTIGTFNFGEPFSMSVEVDLPTNTWIIYKDSCLLFEGQFLYPGGGYPIPPEIMVAVRFNLVDTRNDSYTVSAAIDNIILSGSPESHIPYANAGADQSANIQAECTHNFNLDASVSYDPDGHALTYHWSWNIAGVNYTASGMNPVIVLPVGKHTIQLVANNGIVDLAPDTVVLEVIDLTPLTLQISVDPAVISFADDSMVLIHPTVEVLDDCDPSSAASLINIYYEDAYGIGDMYDSEDIFVDIEGHIYLRAARDTTQRNRVYYLTYKATNASNLKVYASATVIVPGAESANFNGDSIVDLLDLSEFSSLWLETNCVDWDWCDRKDVNRDNVVNLLDYMIFADHWLEEFVDM